MRVEGVSMTNRNGELESGQWDVLEQAIFSSPDNRFLARRVNLLLTVFAPSIDLPYRGNR